MITIYDPHGKRVTASEEDAVEMVEHCGYSETWPRKAKSPDDYESPSKDDRPLASTEAAGPIVNPLEGPEDDQPRPTQHKPAHKPFGHKG